MNDPNISIIRDNVVHGTKSLQELIGEFQQLSQQYK